jgi:hypothetical protein
MQIDIRKDGKEGITEIVFGDSYDLLDAYKVVLDGDMTSIRAMSDDLVYLNSKEDAINLIKALEKAISLGTWD